MDWEEFDEIAYDIGWNRLLVAVFFYILFVFLLQFGAAIQSSRWL